MRTTIDAAGRLVVPKALRAAMRLQPGQMIEIVYRDGRLEIDVAPVSVRIDDADGFPVARPEGELPTLTTETVSETTDETRR